MALPPLAGLDQRLGSASAGVEMLTANAADPLPVEMPWRGTPSSPGALVEAPTRQLIPSLADANALFMAKSCGGKTVMAQIFLAMMARANSMISILERGESYRPLAELMGAGSSSGPGRHRDP